MARAVHWGGVPPAEGACGRRRQAGDHGQTKFQKWIFLSQGVTFYYGISPGQDMRYCESKEQDLLVAKTRYLLHIHKICGSDRKLLIFMDLFSSLRIIFIWRWQVLLFRQLQQLGCKGFAFLLDYIEPELSEEDSKLFASFAEAHCKVDTHMIS